MTDLVTLDLYRIHEDADQLAHLHRIQRDRLQEDTLTGGDRPGGMRLSTADPVRRVKAALDPFWKITLDEGVGKRGHLLEDYLQVALFHGEYAPTAGKLYVTQKPIQWHKHGVSAFDFVVLDHAGSDRVVSCKSSVKSAKPSAANVAQEKRMMVLDGYPAGTVFEVWVLNPSTLRAVGPYEYELTQDDVDAVRLEADAVAAAYAHFAAMPDPTRSDEWNDPAAWRQKFNLVSTSGAFRYATLDASSAIEKRVREFMRARKAASVAESDLETAKKLMKQHVAEQVEAARLVDPDAKRVKAYSLTQVVTFSLDARGTMRVKEEPIEADAAAA